MKVLSLRISIIDEERIGVENRSGVDETNNEIVTSREEEMNSAQV